MLDTSKRVAPVSVVISTFNRPAEVEVTVRNLIDQSVLPLEIIVIDDSSTPPLKLRVDFRGLKVIRFDKEIGLSNARNYGVGIAAGEFIAFVDDDTKIPRHWMEKVLEGIAAGAEVLGGPLRPLFLAEPPSWWSEKEFGGVAGVGNIVTRDIWGANMIFKKVVFDKVGLFNSRVGRQKGKLLTYEETELISRARSCCKLVFLPNAEVLHLIPKKRMTFRYIIRWFYYWGKSTRIAEGFNLRDSVYGIFLAQKMLLRSMLTHSKSRRIRCIAMAAYYVGRFL
jgi:glucosyl-dolichyl phosphate glucuronosyltransferase